MKKRIFKYDEIEMKMTFEDNVTEEQIQEEAANWIDWIGGGRHAFDKYNLKRSLEVIPIDDK